MYKIILLSVALCAAPAFAENKVTVEQLETAMHAAEQDRSKLAYAEELARKAQMQNPDSYKANYYLSQILTYTKKPDQKIYENKADSIRNKTAFSFLSTLFSVIFACIIVFLGVSLYLDNQAKKEKLAKKLDEDKKAKEKYLKLLMAGAKEIDELNIYLELKDVKFNNKIYNDLKELKTSIVDMVEAIHEGNDWDPDEIDDILKDVSKANKHCRDKFN